MGRRASKLKLRVSKLSPRERKIFRPTFRSYGTKAAFRSAVDLLGPFPTPAVVSNGEGYSVFSTRKDSEDECLRLASSYFDFLIEELTSPRLSETLKTFTSIRDLSQSLAHELAYMSVSERYLATRVWGVHPVSEQEKLISLLDQMGSHGPPLQDEEISDERLGSGELAATLSKMNQYFDTLTKVLKRRYGRGGSATVDAGGKVNTSRIIAPNPRWHLVDRTFELFASLAHLSSVDRAKRPLEFILYLHEWVTGDAEASFERVIADYNKVKKELAAQEARRNAGGLNPKTARLLDKKIDALQDQLQYGHRIPARHIASLGA